MVFFCSFKIKAYLLQGWRISNNLQLVSNGGVKLKACFSFDSSLRSFIGAQYCLDHFCVCMCVHFFSS